MPVAAAATPTGPAMDAVANCIVYAVNAVCIVPTPGTMSPVADMIVGTAALAAACAAPKVARPAAPPTAASGKLIFDEPTLLCY